MGIAQDLAYEFRALFPRLPFGQLAAFTGNLATCLEAGLSLPDSLETISRSCPNRLLRSTGKAAAERVRNGIPLSEALEEVAGYLPRFYLPLLRCGEETGRTDEALHYLQKHCALLERPYESMRNLWLVPLVLFLLIDAVTALALVVLAPFSAAVSFVVGRIKRYAVLGATVLLVLNVPQLRHIWEQFVLKLPLFGPAVRDMSVNRFLHGFSLMYRTSNLSTVRMVQTACSAVDNTVIRDEFLEAVPHLERGKSFSESFTRCRSLSLDQKSAIASAEEAGRLDDVLERLCRQTSESLERHLTKIRTTVSVLLYGLYALGAFQMISAFLTAYLLRQVK